MQDNPTAYWGQEEQFSEKERERESKTASQFFLSKSYVTPQLNSGQKMFAAFLKSEKSGGRVQGGITTWKITVRSQC
jgi:hypothetical protein